MDGWEGIKGPIFLNSLSDISSQIFCALCKQSMIVIKCTKFIKNISLYKLCNC